MGEEVRRRSEGFDLRLDADRADELLAEVLPALDGLRDRKDTAVAKANRMRTVLRVPLPGGAVFLKRYHVQGIGEKLKYLVVPTRAAAEWRAARAMRAAGLPVPRAVMAGVKKRGPFLADGCFASEEIAGAEDLVPFVALERPPGRGDAGRRALLADLARLVRRMHDAGFRHRDLHGGNLLVTGPAIDPHLHLIDLHTVTRRRRVRRRTRLGNLAKLLHSLATVANAADVLRFLRSYEGSAPVLGAERAALAGLFRRVSALERRRQRSRTKRCLRDSSEFVTERVGPYRLFRRRVVDPSGVLLAAGDHLLAMERGGTAVLKDAARSAISREILMGPADAAAAVVKRTRIRGPVDLLKNAFRRPRGRASWVNGNGLLVRRFAAARPLALLERGRWPLRGESFLLMEDVSGLTRLDLFVLKRYAGDLSPERRAEKLRLVRGFARFVRRLHRGGVYHGDLKAVNVFVSTAPGEEPRFVLVDYDRVRFGRRVGRRRRVKNLAQIAASVAVLVTRTDRLRFFRAWVPDENAKMAEKAYNRAVLRALRRKIVVRMDPIE